MSRWSSFTRHSGEQEESHGLLQCEILPWFVVCIFLIRHLFQAFNLTLSQRHRGSCVAGKWLKPISNLPPICLLLCFAFSCWATKHVNIFGLLHFLGWWNDPDLKVFHPMCPNQQSCSSLNMISFIFVYISLVFWRWQVMMRCGQR